MSLKVENIYAGYGNIPVLKGVDFQIKPHEMVALIGLNGAGKSTTIKNIMGLLTPYQGKISLDELTLKEDPALYRQKIGYIPESPILYEELTLKEHLEITAMAYNLPVEAALEKAGDLLKLFRLDKRLDWLPANFSKGMKQKVMVVCALMVNPSLLIIDEPFLGLDPLAISDLLNLLAAKKQEGAGILMSTHILATAEKYCDRFIILHEGTIQAQGTLKELQTAFKLPNASLDELYLHLTELKAGGKHDL